MGYDTTAMVVDLTEPVSFHTRDGSVVTDADGTRQPRLLFPGSTTATVVMPNNNSQQNITNLTVRVIEFTVGPHGPAAMPAELPSSSAYTYAAEFSVDEVVNVNAVRVQFSQPVLFYLENFLELPVGLPVPTGFYDRQGGRWEAVPDGRIVGIVSFDDLGRAELDTDGDLIVDNGSALGITDGNAHN